MFVCSYLPTYTYSEMNDTASHPISIANFGSVLYSDSRRDFRESFLLDRTFGFFPGPCKLNGSS